MELALEQAGRSEYVSTAYCVGCVIVRDGRILSTGFSRELSGNTHAEQCALDKLGPGGAAGADLYTTMEPCSLRLSGNVPCVRRVLDSGVRRVISAVSEPADFVESCTGLQQLRDAGVVVTVLDRFAARAERIARGQK